MKPEVQVARQFTGQRRRPLRRRDPALTRDWTALKGQRVGRCGKTITAASSEKGGVDVYVRTARLRQTKSSPAAPITSKAVVPGSGIAS